jgi:hypothetical protein
MGRRGTGMGGPTGRGTAAGTAGSMLSRFMKRR